MLSNTVPLKKESHSEYLQTPPAAKCPTVFFFFFSKTAMVQSWPTVSLHTERNFFFFFFWIKPPYLFTKLVTLRAVHRSRPDSLVQIFGWEAWKKQSTFTQLHFLLKKKFKKLLKRYYLYTIIPSFFSRFTHHRRFNLIYASVPPSYTPTPPSVTSSALFWNPSEKSHASERWQSRKKGWQREK